MNTSFMYNNEIYTLLISFSIQDLKFWKCTVTPHASYTRNCDCLKDWKEVNQIRVSIIAYRPRFSPHG